MKELQPFVGEILSGYVFRLALWCEEFPLAPSCVNDLYCQSFVSSSLDPDYDSTGKFSKISIEALRAVWPGANFSSLFAPVNSFVLPRFYRRSYCYSCLCDQIERSWSPTILRQWGLLYYGVCELHEVSLFDAPFNAKVRINLAHDFFCFHCENNTNVTAGILSKMGSESILKVQCFIESLHSSIEASTINASLLEFCCLSLKIFLYPQYGICNNYNARKEIPLRSPFWQRSHLGVFIATVPERQSAILLLGWVLGIYNLELELLPNHISAVIAHENQNTWWLGAAASHLPDNIYRHSILMLRCLEANIALPSVKQFIDGFSSRFAKRT